MFRTGASRTALRPLVNLSAAPTRTQARSVSTSLVQAALRKNGPVSEASRPLALSTIRKDMSVVRRWRLTASGAVYGTTRDPERERQIQMRPLAAHPERVSATSTTHPLFSEVATKDEKHDDVDMMHDMMHDIQMIRDTFAFQDVPKEAIRLGLAGVLPYLATSTLTLAASFEYNASLHGGSFMLDERTAELILHVLEPVQVGYGAVILSFLGAIHWGMEWAKFGGSHGYKRYAVGVLAPAVAWPTLLLPVETALITQFLSFVGLYTFDAEATRWGWVPTWYASYRFILTFIVGASLLLSLIARGRVMESIGVMPNATDRIREHAEDSKGKKKSKKSSEEEDDE